MCVYIVRRVNTALKIMEIVKLLSCNSGIITISVQYSIKNAPNIYFFLGGDSLFDSSVNGPHR